MSHMRPGSSNKRFRDDDHRVGSSSGAGDDQAHPLPPPPKRNIPVSLGKPSLRLRLEAYYSLIAPDTIADEASWRKRFEQIYEKYGGTVDGEAKLAAKLAKKYGNNVRLLLTTTASASPSAASGIGIGIGSDATTGAGQPSSSAASKRSEEWYVLIASELNSGDISFVSSSFDPQAALSADMDVVLKVNPFVAQAPLIDNVSKFRRLLPGEDPQYLQPTKRSASAAAATRAQKAAAAAAASAHKIPIPGAFAALADRFDKGPFALLRDIHAKKQRVRVMVRYVDCIRGTLTGHVLAFDKHFNMILRDVEEVYSGRATCTKVGSPCSSEKSGGIDEKLSNVEVEVKRRTCFLDERRNKSSVSSKNNNDDGVLLKHRHCQQMLVRGDCVVMIWRGDEERSAFPPAPSSTASASARSTGKGPGMPSAGALLAARAWSSAQDKTTTTESRGKATR